MTGSGTTENMMITMNQIRSPFALSCLLLAFFGAPQAVAQHDNPVYVDDSPHAWSEFQRALEQMDENVGEAVRVLQELLDEYPLRVVPVREGPGNRFVSLRKRINELIRSDRELLERYRAVSTPQAERMARAGAYEQLVLSRALTDPGREAMIVLAQRAVESGHFRRALQLLQEARHHPELADHHAQHVWYLTALAAHHLDEPAIRDDAEDALVTFGDSARPFLEDLDRILGSSARITPVQSRSVLDRTRTDDLTGLVSETIWSAELEDAPHRRRADADRPGRAVFSRSIDVSREEGHLLTLAPAVVDDTVFVSQGHKVMAFDRLSGEAIWEHPYTDRPRLTIVDREDELARDLSLIAVRDDVLVTITGHAHGTSRSSDGRVVCIDAKTGAERWSRRLDRLAMIEDFEGLFPHSAPLISDGKVYILARKVSAQSLSSCYILAFDLESGQLQWHRHVVSSGAIRRGMRSFSAMRYDRGSLYVASAIGAIARLDSRTGETIWLRRYSVPLAPSIHEQNRLPWELTAPVLREDRVIAFLPGTRQIVEVDRETGEQLAGHSVTDSAQWGHPSYLLGDEEYLFVVGRDLRVFAGDDLSEPRWIYPGEADTNPLRSGDKAILGRVQLSGEAVLVPTGRSLKLLSRRTGDLINEIDIREPTNAIADGAQLIAATADDLRVYMSLDRAEEMLRQRIAALPADPGPAISLARLAIRERQLPLILEVATLANDAIQRAPDDAATKAQQNELFSMLLGLDPAELSEDADRIATWFDLIEQTARGEDQVITYRFAYGDWLRHQHPRDAAAQYQKVLDARELRSRLWREEDRAMPARRWASERLGELIEQAGPTVYAENSEKAENALRDAQRQEETPEAFLSIARQFPYAEGAVSAIFEASRLLKERGEPGRSADMVASLLHLTPLELAFTRERIERVGGRVIQQILELDRPADAVSILDFLASVESGLSLESPDGEEERRTVDGWREQIVSDHLRAVPLPQIGSQRGAAVAIDGHLVPVHSHRGASVRRPGHALMRTPRGLELRLPDELTVRWRVNWADLFPDELPKEVVQLTTCDTSLLLWAENEYGSGELVALGLRSGEVLWRRNADRELLPELDQRLQSVRNVRSALPDGSAFRPGASLPRVSEQTVVVAHRMGEVAAVDRETGETIWKRATTFDHIFHAEIDGQKLFIAGLGRAPEAEHRSSMLQVFDLRSGEPHLDSPWRVDAHEAGGDEVYWVQTGGTGTVLYGTETGVHALDLVSQDLLWRHEGYPAVGAVETVSARGIVLLETDGGDVFRIDPFSGRLSGPFIRPDSAAETRAEILGYVIEAGRILVLERQRLVIYDTDGELIGADAVRGERNYRELQRARGRTLIVSALPPLQQPDRGGRGGGWTTRHPHRIYTVADDGRLIDETLEIPPLPDPIRDSSLIDGWLLLSTDGRTYAVPFPLERDASAAGVR